MSPDKNRCLAGQKGHDLWCPWSGDNTCDGASSAHPSRQVVLCVLLVQQGLPKWTDPAQGLYSRLLRQLDSLLNSSPLFPAVCCASWVPWVHPEVNLGTDSSWSCLSEAAPLCPTQVPKPGMSETPHTLHSSSSPNPGTGYTRLTNPSP